MGMADIYVLDRNLKSVGIVDTCKSLIWANRYNSVGDCELYIPASEEYLNLLKMGYFLYRTDSPMVCQIKKIEIDTDAEEGNYLIVTGYDVKRWLDQRIIWNTSSADGNAEAFIRSIVDEACGNSSTADRQIKDADGNRIFFLSTASGFSDVITEQISYKTVGEKVREYCLKFGWGYKLDFIDNAFYFSLYKGTDRTDTVVFADEYENLCTTTYITDDTNMGNIALICGQGEGANRARNIAGSASGMNRYEVYIDAKDLSRNITWAELIALYPTIEDGGEGYIFGASEIGWSYWLETYDCPVIDANHLAWLHQKYTHGQEVTIDGVLYYEVYDEIIADLPNETPDDDTVVVLDNLIYMSYLINRGYERLADYGATTTFDGTIEPNMTFVYNKDYFLGDTVTIRNQYGIDVDATITEIVEVYDENGYSVEPKFEYKQTNQGGII